MSASDYNIFNGGANDVGAYVSPATDDTDALAPAPTANANLGSLVEDIVYRVPGCSDLMVRKMLQNAWRDFAERSAVMKIDFSTALTQTNSTTDKTYAITETEDIGEIGATDVFVVSIDSAWLKKTGTGGFLRRLFEAQDIMLDTSSVPQRLILTSPPASVTNTALLARLVALPKRGSENIPKAILDRHGDAIVHGALSRIYAMTGQAWSDAAQAQIEAALYDEAVKVAAEKTVFGDQVGNGRYTIGGVSA